MAITPEQAGKITKEEIKVIEKAELEVDKILRKGFQGSGTVRVTGSLSKLSRRCLDELLRRYRALDWSIEKKHESRDQQDPRGCPGYDYWVFKPAPNYTNTGFSQQYYNSEPPPWRDEGPLAHGLR